MHIHTIYAQYFGSSEIVHLSEMNKYARDYNLYIYHYNKENNFNLWNQINGVKLNDGMFSFEFKDYSSSKVEFILKNVTIGNIKEETYEEYAWDGKKSFIRYNLLISCNTCITKYRNLVSNLIIASDNKTVLERFKRELVYLQKIKPVNHAVTDNNKLTQEKNLDNISPKILISNIEFKDNNDNKRIDQQESSYFIVTLKNYGQNEQKDIKVKVNELSNLKGILVKKENQLPILLSNQSKTLKFNLNSSDDLETGDAKFEFKVYCGDSEITKKQVQITALNSGSEEIIISTIPDIDKNIPVAVSQRNNTYALIVGNEDYKSKQPNLSNESNVKFAVNDAKIFKEYLNKTLGIPKTNITLITNATAVQINQGVNKFKLLPQINPNAEIIFYYAGHGLPDQATKEQYLIPVDVNGSNITYGLKINDIISELNINNPKKLIMILDACFSGAGREESLLSNRGVRIVPKDNIVKNNTIIFSSSSSSEASKTYEEMQHGMFTYFLLKKLKETKGNASLQDLYDYTYFQVREKSLLINNQIQTPTIVKSPAFTKPLDEIKF